MIKKRFHRKPKIESSAFSLNQAPVSLEIEKLTFGGDGLSRQDGLIYFVPMSAPGDQLQVQVTEQKKNFSRGEIIEIQKASTLRTSAPCPYFGKCGGCQWQHITYAEQLKQKQSIVTEILRSVINSKTQFSEILSSPESYRYRNRIQLKYDGKNLGFYSRKSHDIVDIDDCLITEEILAQEIPVLRAFLKKNNYPPQSKIEIFIDTNGKVQRHFENEEDSDSLAFSQVNRLQNDILIEKVLSWMQPHSPEKIYDLYAGSGNFTFPLSKKFPKASITAVELGSKAVQDAKQTIIQQNISPLKLRFYLADVELFLKRQILAKDAVILLDPPRTGCSEQTIKYLASSDVKRIFYVSCNPSTLARDIQRMQTEKPWRIHQVQAFDMFPQTSHVETLVELVVDSE